MRCPSMILFSAVALLGQETQTVTLDHKLQVPGATLKPGQYTFMVEDRLEDRAIIRITSGNNNSHELLLAVPNDKLNESEHGKLLFFPTGGADKQILQGWMCPSCQSALEVVYPKGEAVKITGESAKPVIAVDPTYDKLPKNLLPDDMKVVTLWLLSPKEVTPEQKGKGVTAAKYVEIRNSQRAQTAGIAPQTAGNPSPTDAETKRALDRATAPPPPGAMATTNGGVSVSNVGDSPSAASAPASTTGPAKASDSKPIMDDAVPAVSAANAKPPAAERLSAPTQLASTRRMPHTAGNTYDFGLAGLLMLSAGVALRMQRRFRLQVK